MDGRLNRGDTVCFGLDYNLNGSPLQEDAYQEIEFQINNEKSSKSIKKLFSKGEIVWGTIEKRNGEMFTGYYVKLSQKESFMLNAGPSMVQLRIKVDDEVGSSDESSFDLGAVLSSKVL